MSLPYIRKTYSVPAKRGVRLRYTDGDGVIWNGTITSAIGPRLRVLVDDRIPGYRGRIILHPTHNVEYMPASRRDNDECRVATIAETRKGNRT